jgi:hypothetical protein
MSASPPTFDDYWAVFVRAHASAVVRRVHFISVSAALGCAALGLATRRGALLLAAPVIAVVPSVIARRLAGGDVRLPRYPLYGVAAGLKMWRMTLEGRMDAEVERIFGSEPEGPGEGAAPPVPRPNMVTDHTLH